MKSRKATPTITRILPSRSGKDPVRRGRVCIAGSGKVLPFSSDCRSESQADRLCRIRTAQITLASKACDIGFSLVVELSMVRVMLQFRCQISISVYDDSMGTARHGICVDFRFDTLLITLLGGEINCSRSRISLIFENSALNILSFGNQLSSQLSERLRRYS